MKKIKEDLEKTNKLKKLNHIILVPVFNDWKSFNRLTFEIEKKFKFLKGYNNQILVINDKSTIKKNKKETL